MKILLQSVHEDLLIQQQGNFNRYMDEVFLMKITDYSTSAYQSQLAYLTKTQMDMVSGEVYISDPRVYTAKQNDPDMPSFDEAVRCEFAVQYLEAMKKEISSLMSQKTWMNVSQSEANNVLMSTWEFRSRDYLMGLQASSRQDSVLELIFRKKEWISLKLMHQ